MPKLKLTRLFFAIITCLFTLKLSEASVPTEKLFQHGVNYGDTFLAPNDDGFVRVTLQNSFGFFYKTYTSLFVNTNGAVSFGEGVGNYTPTCDATTIPMINLYWADVDIRFGGNVSYRESFLRSDLALASTYIWQAFPELPGVKLLWAFIVTWFEVPFFEEVDVCNMTDIPITNTFQLVLTSDGTNSFILFLYNNISWTTGRASGGDCTGLGGAPAKVGYDLGDNSTLFEIPNSCTGDILSVADGTNVPGNISGLYAFRVNSGYDPASCASFTRSNQLRITPGFVSTMGHVPIQIQGPCLDNTTDFTCSFQHPLNYQTIIDVAGAQLSGSNSVVCPVPYLDGYGRVRVILTLNRNGNTELYAGGIYTTAPSPTVNFGLSGNNGSVSLVISWDVAQFGNSSVPLDFILMESGDDFQWVERSILVSGVQSNSPGFYGSVNLGTPNGNSTYAIRVTTSPAVLNVLPSILNNSISQFSSMAYLGPMDSPSSIAACQNWFQRDNGPPPSFQLIPCPPTLNQARTDVFFTIDGEDPPSPGAEYSFRQRFAKEGGQQCNYFNGSILIGPTGGGTADSFSHVVRAPAAHYTKDIVPWKFCCRYSNDDASCRNYYEKRPSDAGTNYVAPPTSMVGGDPHIITFDGTEYLFNADGEFWMIKSTNFSMQGRMTQYVMSNGTLAPASVFTDFAMRQYPTTSGSNITTVQVSVQLFGFFVYINGEIFTLDPNAVFPYTVPFGEVTITVDSATQLTLGFGFGNQLTFVITTTGNNTSLNLIATARTSFFGQLNGLMGYYDGLKSNDLRAPNGTTVSVNASTEIIHYGFGIPWRTSANESIFTYTDGKTWDSYQNTAFVPNFLNPDPATLPANVQTLCGNLTSCQYDYASTGDFELAQDTLTLVTTYMEDRKSLDVVVPMCSPLQKPVNGYFKADNFFVGTTATFTCDTSYKMNGYSQTSCVKTGNNPPHWTHSSPTCTLCCLNGLACAVCRAWADLWHILHLPPPFCVPGCCPVSFYS